MAFNFDKALQSGETEESVRTYLRSKNRETEADQYFSAKKVSTTTPIKPVRFAKPAETTEEPGFFSRVGTDLKNRLGNVKEGYARQDAGQQSVFSTGLQIAGNVAGGASDVVGEAITSIPGVKSGIETVGKAAMNTEIGQKAGRKAEDLMADYNVWKEKHPEAAANLEATGAIAEWLPIGKAAGLAYQGTKKAVGVGVKVAKAGTKVVGTGVEAGAKIGTEALGISTGAGAGNVKQAFRAGYEGGDVDKAFKATLRGGETTGQELVAKVKQGVSDVKESQRQTYRAELAEIAKDKKNYSIEPVLKEKEKLFVPREKGGFGVEKIVDEDGVVQYSLDRSTLTDKKSIEEIMDLVDNWGTKKGDRTGVGLDTLKQKLDNIYNKTGDERLKAYVAGLRKQTRTILKEVDGYDALEIKHDQSRQFLDLVDQVLSPDANPEVAVNKLRLALSDNRPLRQALVQDLEKVTGEQIEALIAGRNMQNWMPKGLSRYVLQSGAGALVGGGVIGGAGVTIAGLPLLAVFGAISSPRAAAEMLRAAGITARKAEVILKNLDEIRLKYNITESTAAEVAEKLGANSQ